jgi:hypothetical protein
MGRGKARGNIEENALGGRTCGEVGAGRKKQRRKGGVGEVRKIYEVEGGIGIGSGLGFVHVMTRDGLRLLVTELR